MDELTAFLKTRLDEDEAAAVAAAHDSARLAGRGTWSTELGTIVTDAEDPDWAICDLTPFVDDECLARHIARHDPARVLREVAAKRAILAQHGWFIPDVGWSKGERCCNCCGAGMDDVYLTAPWPCETVKALAAIWSYHPDYREEWKP